MVRTSAVFAAIALVCSPAVAAGGQDAVQRYLAAAAQVSEVLSRPNLETLPRANDPRIAGAFAIITDVKAVLKPRRFKVDDIGILNDVCNKNVEIMMRYMLFDPKRKLDPKSTEPAGVMQTMVFTNENVRAYQDEIAPLLAFSLRCPAVTIPLLGTFIARLPPEDFDQRRRRGLEKMRIGYLTSYLAGVRCFTRDSPAPLTPANARRIIDALVDTAPVYAGFFPLDARDQILAAANQARDATPKFAPALDKIARAMARRDCVDLCAR